MNAHAPASSQGKQCVQSPGRQLDSSSSPITYVCDIVSIENIPDVSGVPPTIKSSDFLDAYDFVTNAARLIRYQEDVFKDASFVGNQGGPIFAIENFDFTLPNGAPGHGVIDNFTGANKIRLESSLAGNPIPVTITFHLTQTFAAMDGSFFNIPGAAYKPLEQPSGAGVIKLWENGIEIVAPPIVNGIASLNFKKNQWLDATPATDPAPGNNNVTFAIIWVGYTPAGLAFPRPFP